MPGIVALVSAISDEVVARLAAANYPPLTDGKILLGQQHVKAQSAPPRIIFVPRRSTFRAKDASSAMVLSDNKPYSPERLIEISQQAVMTDEKSFQVRCWGTTTGTAADTIRDEDYDFTEALYQTVIAAVDHICRGVFGVDDGDWTDAKESTPQLNVLGREFVFGITLATPVLKDTLVFAPPGVAMDGQVAFSDGPSEGIPVT